MGDDGRVVGDPTEVLTRSGGTGYVSLSDVEATGEPTTEATGSLSMDAPTPVDAPRRSRFPLVGWAALFVAIAAGVLTGVGVALTADGEFVTGATVAWVAIALSCIAVLGGIVAVIARFGRLPGVAAILLGLLANPFLLTQLLGAVQQLSAASAATI